MHEPTLAIGSDRHADTSIVDRDIDLSIVNAERLHRAIQGADVELDCAIALGAVLHCDFRLTV